MKRAVVLGGGGSVGVAWEVGIAAGLLDGGIDLREADLIIGTSAGAYVGSHLATGTDPREMLRGMREAPAVASGQERTPDSAAATAAFWAWGNLELEEHDRCVQVGRAALAADTATESELLETFGQTIPESWPEKPLLVTAVNAETGDFRVFDARSHVALRPAVVASCAVPAIFPPITIDGARYMDGGVRSMTSADLAQQIEPDLVLIVSVFGFMDRGTHRVATRDLAREMAALETVGATVRAIRFDGKAANGNLMDAAGRLPAAADGEAEGRALGAEWRSWWAGRRQ